IENMDSRKGFGKTEADLQSVFERLPEASFCFDIGHARQIDPTLKLARQLLTQFSTRLRQIHLSAVNSYGGHEALTEAIVAEFQSLSSLVPERTPVILETSVTGEGIAEQINLARQLFTQEIEK